MSQAQFQTFLAQKKYRQAIDELKKLQHAQPNLEIAPSEAQIWSLRGQQELQNRELKAAENSFRQALKLGNTEQIYYWLAKSLVKQNRLDAALELVQTAFEQKTLPKEESICYLKLLLLKGDRATVESLISKQSKRFSAAQLHWTKGVLALQTGDPETAIASFSKVKHRVTSGDSPEAWLAYAYQQSEQWELAAAKLGVGRSMVSPIYGKPKLTGHPMMMKLAVVQQAHDGDLERIFMPKDDRQTQEIMPALSAIQLMQAGNFHDAGHAVLKLKSSPRVADLLALKSQILTIAGQQAMNQGMMSCAIQLWEPLLQSSEFNPQLAINLQEVFAFEEEDQQRQRLLTRLIKWIEQDAKQNPPKWPEDYRKRTLAHAHCLMADCWIALNRYRTAIGEVQQAERLDPTSPEAIGRRGLLLDAEDQTAQAITHLTQALEQGCQALEVYERLPELLKESGRNQEALEIRKRYGHKFGDLDVAAEITVEPWVDAIATRNYDFFKITLPKESTADPQVRACQIFHQAAHGKPTSTGKTSIHQDQATQAWDQLLAGLEPLAKMRTLQTITLTIEVLAKRDKGIAAIVSRYQSQMIALLTELPEERFTYLTALAVIQKNSDRIEIPLQTYLATQPQPGNALAQLQLRVRWFALVQSLRPAITAALVREPQNPLLLLAQATTYSPNSQPYEQYRQQGFELARRLQDAKALEAFRTEDFYLRQQTMQAAFPNPGSIDINNMMPSEFEDLFEDLIRKVFGKELPPPVLEQMMPMLKQQFLAELPDGGGDFDDDDFGDDFDLEAIFGKPKKRKRSFMDL
jgi:tetratricopeptide (TPR) repeat protein